MFRWRRRSSSVEEVKGNQEEESSTWNYVTTGVCLKLGSKSDVFLRDGNTWLCSTGLPSDVIIQVGETSFRFHKFPLLSRSGILEKLIEQSRPHPESSGRHNIIHLHDIPGGAKTFLLVAKFCYGVRFELNSSNIVGLRCAAEFLQMTDDYGDNNLALQTELFLNAALGNWVDTLSMLESCQDSPEQLKLLLPWAEKLHIVSRCIDSLATKACAEFTAFDWTAPLSTAAPNHSTTLLWNGIRTSTDQSEQPHPAQASHDWWHEDVAHLKLPFYRRLIRACELKGMKAESVAGSVIYYAKKYLSMTTRFKPGTTDSSSSSASSSSSTSCSIAVPPSLFDPDQRYLLEEIVDLLPEQTGVVPINFLLTLLQTAIAVHASPSCVENLEKRVGAQFDQASMEDLLIPNLGYSAETLYDIDCVQRILDHFLATEKDNHNHNHNPSVCFEYIPQSNIDGDEGSNSVTKATRVADLIDRYLAEVATDVNLKLPKFQSIAGAVPEYGRLLDDGIYRAIDIYLKAHPWLTDHEKEQICRQMNFQKLSLEASTHAAQNQRLPLRVIVQVLFFEQLRLRTSIAGCLLVSENLDNNNNNHRNPNLLMGRSAQLDSSARFHSSRHHGHREQQIIAAAVEDDVMREKVIELEKECMSIRQDLERMVKNKRSWNLVTKKLGGLRLKSISTEQKRNTKLTKVAAAMAPSLPLPSSAPVKFIDHGKGYEGEWFD